MAVLAPIPKARERTATAVTVGVRQRPRHAYRRSFIGGSVFHAKTRGAAVGEGGGEARGKRWLTRAPRIGGGLLLAGCGLRKGEGHLTSGNSDGLLGGVVDDFEVGDELASSAGRDAEAVDLGSRDSAGQDGFRRQGGVRVQVERHALAGDQLDGLL